MSTALQQPEPATICYTLDKAWPDLIKVCQRTWEQAQTFAGSWFVKYKWDDYWASLPFRVGAAVGAIAGGLLVCVLGFIAQGSILLLVSSVRLLVTALFWTVEWIWRAKWKLFGVCDDCGHCSDLPAYVCDHCGAMHRALLPNRHGILTHRCTCGKTLNSSFLSGRGRHAACCPIDAYPMTHFGITPVLIALGGGPSNGKTNLLYRSLDALTDIHADKRNWKLTWQDGDGERFQALEAQHQQDAIRNTPNELPRAFRLRLVDPCTSVDRMLRIYDPGGEAFKEQDSLNAHAYYQRIAGAVFVVDPFALASVQQMLNETAKTLIDVRPGVDHSETWFERLLQIPGIAQTNKQSDVCLAIVITKTDARDLIHRVRKNYAGLDAHDAGKAFLIDCGLAAIVSQAESHFRQVRMFFAGRDDTRTDEWLDPAGPMLWIIDNAAASDFSKRLKG